MYAACWVSVPFGRAHVPFLGAIHLPPLRERYREYGAPLVGAGSGAVEARGQGGRLSEACNTFEKGNVLNSCALRCAVCSCVL